ncbi:MAG TPA: hypothetical protein VEJ63_15540 [Planctomycetota bacterium]|nr:hypothetical protein [Planctomycetota bacterium]
MNPEPEQIQFSLRAAIILMLLASGAVYFHVNCAPMDYLWLDSFAACTFVVWRMNKPAGARGLTVGATMYLATLALAAVVFIWTSVLQMQRLWR